MSDKVGNGEVENTKGQTVVPKTDKRPIAYILDACCRLHSVQYWYNFCGGISFQDHETTLMWPSPYLSFLSMLETPLLFAIYTYLFCLSLSSPLYYLMLPGDEQSKIYENLTS